MKKKFWLIESLFLGVFAVALHASDAAYPIESQVLKDINSKLTKSKLESVKMTSGWALSWVDMSRKPFQPPDQAVCDVTIVFVKDAKGEQGSSEAVVYYTRDILRPNLPWSYQKVDILTSRLIGRPDMSKDEMTKILLESLSGKDGERAQRLILPNSANLVRVYKVAAAEPSNFKWSTRESMTFEALIEYDAVNGYTDLDRRERVIRVGFEKRDGVWFMNDMGQGKDKTIKTTKYQKVQLEKMTRLSKSSWSEIYKPEGAAGAASADTEKAYPPSKDLVDAIKKTLGASEKHFNQILGSRIVDKKVVIDDLAAKVYEIAVKEEGLDFNDFQWGKDGGFSLPVSVAYYWKETSLGTGKYPTTYYWKKGESQVYMMNFKPSASGGYFVSGCVGTGQKKSLMDSKIGESTYAALGLTFKEKFAQAQKK